MTVQLDLLGKEIPVNIRDEMSQSYLDYAMSVIVSRAIPDVRDGLKPVHRRVLFSMHELTNRHDKPYKKSARVVGDCIGKYHPHGESAVYDTIVRMAQDFSMRYTLIDGQGNFGSVDGDSAAAMRYTEIRMQKITDEILSDLEKETVDFAPTYDDSMLEPTVLPAAIPNILINGSSGIAVGMATNIPPHNLGEVVDGLIKYIEDPDITIAKLMKCIPAPDFPTGAMIYGYEGIKSAYHTGRGVIKLRARAEIVPAKGGTEHIIISEIPYQLNKASLIEKIADLVKEKKIEDISDLRDESDREGMRIVIELKRGANSEIVLNNLYKKTRMTESFGIILLALVNGRPQVMNLKEILANFLEHRKEVVTRRTKFELKKAEARAHVLEGLKIALDNLDAVIELIKSSPGPVEAKEGLIKKFMLSEIQAQAILDMRLQRLTGLERDKIIEEYREILKIIARYKEILANRHLVLSIIREELELIKLKYGDPRKTEIVQDMENIESEDLIQEEDVVITCSRTGYVKRTPVSSYKKQLRGGKGVKGMATKEQDIVSHLFIASTHDHLLVFTDKGRVYWLKVYKLPEVGSAAKGRPIVNLLNLNADEKVASLFAVRDFSEGLFVVTATARGVIKKSSLDVFNNPRQKGIIAQRVDDNDSIISVKLTDGTKDIFIATRDGKSIRFSEKEVRQLGRVSRGVKGMTLTRNDRVVDMQILEADEGSILSVTENGFGKRSRIQDYRAQHRGGKGLVNIKTSGRNGKVIASKFVLPESEVMIITQNGKIIRIKSSQSREIGRNTQGVKLINLDQGDAVVAVAKVVERDGDGPEEMDNGLEGALDMNNNDE